MNLSAENIGAIRELVRSGYPLKARDAKDLLGHNDHLVELLEARSRLMLGVEIERDQLRTEVAGLRTGYEAYEQVNAELKAENEALRKELPGIRPFKPYQDSPVIGFTGCVICGVYTDHGGLPCPKTRATADTALGQGEQS